MNNPQELLHGGICDVPSDIAVCPECGGPPYVQNVEWNSATGVPTVHGCNVDCENKDESEEDAGVDDEGFWVTQWPSHKHWQSDWQPVRDRVWRWIEENFMRLSSDA